VNTELLEELPAGTQRTWLGRHGVWLVLALTACVRALVLLVLPYVIATDGVRYVARAEHLAAGDWGTAFAGADFNLFPLLMAWLYRLLSLAVPLTLEQAGLALNMVCGIVLVYYAYKIAEQYFGSVAALVAGVYLALLPELVNVSCSVVREAPYLCVLLAACYLVLSAVREADAGKWKLLRLSAAGALFLMAALLRLEALGILLCAGLVVCVAHVDAGWQARRRVRALAALFVLVPVVAVACLGSVRAVSGQWHFARLDKLHRGYSLGKRHVALQDALYITKTSAYREDGSVDVPALVRINFFKMATRNREVLCVSEIVTALVRALQLAGVLLLLGLAWRLRLASWRVWLQPVSVLCVSATVLLCAVFMRYVLNNYVFSPRYALTLIVLWCIPMSAGWRAFGALSGWKKWLGVAAVSVAVVWLLVEVFQPKAARYLPMKTAGKVLQELLPADARIVAAPSLQQVGYYARRAFVTLPARGRAGLPAYLAATNGYLLVNTLEPWQAEHYSQLTSGLRRVDIELPGNTKFQFTLHSVGGEVK